MAIVQKMEADKTFEDLASSLLSVALNEAGTARRIIVFNVYIELSIKNEEKSEEPPVPFLFRIEESHQSSLSVSGHTSSLNTKSTTELVSLKGMVASNTQANIRFYVTKREQLIREETGS